MASLVIGTHPALPLFFNVGQRVGEGGTNNTEDVALASYLMCLVMKAPGQQGGPLNQRAAARMTLTTTCTPAFIQSIRDLQEITGSTRDGRISPSTPGGSHSGGLYMIARLNGSLMKHYPGLWPRIDLIPTVPTPSQVQALIKRTIGV